VARKEYWTGRRLEEEERRRINRERIAERASEKTAEETLERADRIGPLERSPQGELEGRARRQLDEIEGDPMAEVGQVHQLQVGPEQKQGERDYSDRGGEEQLGLRADLQRLSQSVDELKTALGERLDKIEEKLGFA